MLRKPGSQIPKASGESGKAGFLVFGSSVGVRDTDTGVNPSL